MSFPSFIHQENEGQRWKAAWPEVSQGKVVQLSCKCRCDFKVHDIVGGGEVLQSTSAPSRAQCLGPRKRGVSGKSHHPSLKL